METANQDPHPIDGEPPKSVMMCRMAFSLPSYSCCLVRSTEVHPDISIEVLSGLPISDTEMVEDIRLTGPGPLAERVEELRKCPGVRSVEVLQSDETFVSCRIRHPICPVVRLHQQLRVPPTLPATIEKGSHNVIFTASPDDMRRIYEVSRKKYRDIRIVSLHPSVLEGKEAILTERQQQVFREAYVSGYWDIPRKTSVSALADRLRVSKSTLAEIMTRIESKLMHAAADDVSGEFHEPVLSTS